MDLITWGVDQPGALWALSIIRGGGRGNAKGPFQLDVGGSTLVGPTSVTDGQWHHIAVVLPERDTPRIQDVQVYLDGRIKSGTIPGDGPIDTLEGYDVRFGMRAGDEWMPFEDSLDEVRIYSRALTPEEIAELAGVLE